MGDAVNRPAMRAKLAITAMAGPPDPAMSAATAAAMMGWNNAGRLRDSKPRYGLGSDYSKRAKPKFKTRRR